MRSRIGGWAGRTQSPTVVHDTGRIGWKMRAWRQWGSNDGVRRATIDNHKYGQDSIWRRRSTER